MHIFLLFSIIDLSDNIFSSFILNDNKKIEKNLWKILLIYHKALKNLKYKYFMKYYYIITKIIKKEEIIIQNRNVKLFNDYKRKEEMMNQLQQKYFYKEGEKYTFFPIINNYIIKYKNPCFFNDKYAMSANNTQKFNFTTSLSTNSKKNFFYKNERNKRFNKNQMIKRIEVINHNNSNSKNYFIISKNGCNNTFKLSSLKNKKRSPIIFKRVKTEQNLLQINQREKTLKNIKNKSINNNIRKKSSTKDMNKLIDSIFNISIDNNKKIYKKNLNLNAIKTESSLIFTNDESNIFSDKTNNNYKLQTESGSTYDNITVLLKKINNKNEEQINYNNSSKRINNYIYNKKIDKSRNKIINIDLSKSKDKTDDKKIYNKIYDINNKFEKGKNKIIPLFPYKKITIIKNNSKLKKRDLNGVLNKVKNNGYINSNFNNRYYPNINRTQKNKELTNPISNKEIYKNISFEIKNKKLANNNEVIKDKNSIKINFNESSKKDEDNFTIQSLSDSKVFEIANSYIDDKIDKTQVNDILTQKKHNKNFYFKKNKIGSFFNNLY